jgi:hypothetical protein
MPYLYNPTADDYSINVGGPYPVRVPAESSIEVSDDVAAQYADHPIFQVQAGPTPNPATPPSPPAPPEAVESAADEPV